MIVCLKDVVIHITYLDPFAGLLMTFWGMMCQFMFHVILLYCFACMS